MTFRRAWPLFAVALIALLVPTAAVADSQSNQLSSSYTTSYLILGYNSQWCANHNETKYQIINVEQRWYRSSSIRRISEAQYHYGAVGELCNGNRGLYSSGTQTFHPCYACESSTSPAWTPSYLYWPYDWGYVGGPAPFGTEYVGTWVKTWITDQSGNQTGFICNQVYLYNAGNGPC